MRWSRRRWRSRAAIAVHPLRSLVETKSVVVAGRIDAIRLARQREDATFARLVGAADNNAALDAFLDAGTSP